jgi:two-component system sensor histidine kinase PilS (NtrC family)
MSAVDALQTPRAAPQRKAQSAPEPRDLAWRVLILLNLFRLILACVLLAAFWLFGEPRIIGDASPTLAWGTMSAMLAASIAELLVLRRRLLAPRIHAYLQFVLDAIAFTSLMHASGGVSSGIGGLLIVSVGALALLVPAERAFLLASLATLAILLEQSVAQLQGMTSGAEYTPAGILGAVIFVITGVMQLLRRRLVETEALAEQRGLDLQNLAELNEYIIQHLRESIVVVDGNDRVRLMNESAAKHLAVDSRQAGRDLTEVSAELAGQLRSWRQETPRSRVSPMTLVSADGSTTIQPHFAPLGASDGGAVLVFLEDASLLAERVQQSKLAALGRLSASIAHEIRNPIGAMSHAGQLLGESPVAGREEQRLTDIIRANARRVSQIVDSVLTLSRRESTRPQRLHLKTWMAEFVREFVQTLELYEGSLVIDPDCSELEVDIDPTHLHQVVWNLCDNAVKYASEAAGAICVELACGRLEGSGRPYMEIADRGPGIPAEKVEAIFEPFFTSRQGGTGLGLFISRELCESNGAALRYQPRPDGGSLFRIVFADPQRWQTTEPLR